MLQQVSAHPEGLRRQSWLGSKSRGLGVHHGEPGAGWSCGNGGLAVQPWVAQETSSPGTGGSKLCENRDLFSCGIKPAQMLLLY